MRPESLYDQAPYTPLVRPLTIEKKIFRNDDGDEVVGEQGTMSVPEVRGLPDSQSLTIAFIRIPARVDNPAPPVVLLHGGPSQDGIIQSRSTRLNILTEMQDVGDLILLDGRGLGLSTPTLKCLIDTPRFTIDFQEMKKMYTDEGSRCWNHFRAEGVMIDGYNPVALADDVADLMVSLGYETFSVTGNSYGAYWSMALAKRHPQLIHRLAISGVFGLDGATKLPTDAQQAFDDLLMRLEGTPAVRKLFGAGGIVQAYERVMSRLDAQPVEVSINVGGAAQPFLFDTHTVSRIFYFAEAINHREGAKMLPLLIYAFDKKAYAGIATLLANRFEEAMTAEPLHFGLSSISIICNQVTSAKFDAQFEEQSKLPVRDIWVGQQIKYRNAAYACDEVGFPRIGTQWAEPFQSDAPVFAMIGSFDGTTPPGGAMRSLSNFTSVKTVVVEGGGHRHREIEAAWPDYADFRKRFLAGDPLDDLPQSVELPPIDAISLPWYARILFNIGLGDAILKRM
ncbi:MAG: alpha/beta hydrolase [Pseudomonadota bacterium]